MADARKGRPQQRSMLDRLLTKMRRERRADRKQTAEDLAAIDDEAEPTPEDV